MNKKTIWTLVAAAVAVGIAIVLLSGPSDEPVTAKKEPTPAMTVGAGTPKGPPIGTDVRGLPRLIPRGAVFDEEEISFDEYIERFGALALIDTETRKIRSEVEASLQYELAGKQVTWDGWVKRIQTLPSGRVMLVIGTDPAQPGLDAAMIKFTATMHDEIYGYQKGDRVRVVALYDRLQGTFPSLLGISIETAPAAG